MKKISKKEIGMLACVLIIGALFLVYSYYYQPLITKGEALKAELIQKTEEYEKISKKIEGRETLIKTESDLLKKLKQSLETYYPEIDIEEYIVKLNLFINEAEIELKSISFQKPEQGYLQVSESNESEDDVNIESTEYDEDIVSSSVYGLSGGEFTISFSCYYNTMTEFMQILEQNQKSIVCNRLDITPTLQNDEDSDDEPLYEVTMSIVFLEVYGLDEYFKTENQAVLQSHPYEYAIIENPFAKGG